tara:strand:- start:661 stop:1332 length:672 start_codon:yes stop_codon:yes gene_type:complete
MKAVYYIRTSSATNLEGDSEERQKVAIYDYAENNGYEIVQGAYDQAVKGSDLTGEREGYKSLLEYCLANDVSVILCENASRFARDVVVQELGYQELKKLNLTLIPVDAPDYFTGDSPSLTMIRQILGAVSEFEKSNLVSKLRGARERIKAEKGKCGGRKSLQEHFGYKKFMRLVKRVKSLHGLGLSSQKVADGLWDEGWMQPTTERPLNKSQVRRLIKLGEET